MAPKQKDLLHFYIDLITVAPGLFCGENSVLKMIFGLTPLSLTPTRHFFFQICSLFLIKCGNKEDDFPAIFLFHSSSLYGLIVYSLISGPQTFSAQGWQTSDVFHAAFKHSGQSVTASDFGSNGPRFESGRGRCVESLDKALYSHCPKEKPSH